MLGTALERSLDENQQQQQQIHSHARPMRAGQMYHQEQGGASRLSRLQADHTALQLKLRDYADVIRSLSSSQQALLGRMAELAREGRMDAQGQGQGRPGGWAGGSTWAESGAAFAPFAASDKTAQQGRNKTSADSARAAVSRPGRRLVGTGKGRPAPSSSDGRDGAPLAWCSGAAPSPAPAFGNTFSLYESLADGGGAGAAFAFPALPGSPVATVPGSGFFAGPGSPMSRPATFLGLGSAPDHHRGGADEAFIEQHAGLLQGMLEFMEREGGEGRGAAQWRH